MIVGLAHQVDMVALDRHVDHAEVGAGGFVFLPRGIPHSWDTIGEATLLMITTPPMLESFL
ncbi:MAG TPA: hypothetical protein PK479_05550, partial [Novosphingobium sp.]|nr:hypothetical protein [Novosphingobium sp.]